MSNVLLNRGCELWHPQECLWVFVPISDGQIRSYCPISTTDRMTYVRCTAAERLEPVMVVHDRTVDTPPLAHPSWPFTGRDEVLTEVRALMARPRRSGLLIMGRVGVGKTRLARELLARTAISRAQVWRASASESSAGISFGALAHLLPAALPTADEHANLLRVLADALLADAGDEQILFVDDAHLLDDSSAALVLHLAVRGDIRIVLTARSGMPMPDAVEALLRGSYVTQVDLPPLGQDAVRCLLERTLRGQVQTATTYQLWKTSGGNVFWLQQLVDAGLAAEALAPVDEVWRWQGPFRFSTRLIDLVSAHIGRLSPAMQQAAELLAIGEPLGLTIFEQLTSPAMLDELDVRHLVISEEDGRRTHVRLAHPLYGEVLRQRMPVHRRRRYCRLLATAVQRTGMRRRDDLTRVGAWHLEAGDLDDPQLLLAAARHAILTMDFTLATRLAQAACDTGGGAPAQRTLAIALGYTGRGVQAEQINNGLSQNTMTPRDHVQSVLTRAASMYMALDRPADALALIHRAEQAMTDTAARAELAAQQATILALQGEWPSYEQAISRARRYSATPNPHVTVWVNYAHCVEHFSKGRTRAATQLIESTLPLLSDDDQPVAREGLLSWLCTAQAFAGRLREAETTAITQHQHAQATGWEASLGVWQVFLARITARQGRLRSARRYMREASSILKHNSTWGQHALLLGEWAAIEGQAGNAAQAQTMLDEAHLAQVESYRVLHFLTFRMARPWILAAQGRLRDAARQAIRTADDARRRGVPLWEAELLHIPVRLGQSAAVADRLTALAATTDAPHIDLYARQAHALDTRDAPAMERVCAALDTAGMRLHAAEAAAQTARLWSVDGNTIRAQQAADRCHQLTQHCEGVMTPAVLACRTPGLTDRERHIARLAATGQSSRHIATQLGITPRTVDNHLYRVYNKTGIKNRKDLQELVGL